jgi:hypothetical protein
LNAATFSSFISRNSLLSRSLGNAPANAILVNLCCIT